MNKKPYEAPTVKKVKLVIQNAVLASCHVSPTNVIKGVASCAVTANCYNPPVAP